uniref:Si:ch211-263p13.7 n=1 Tax=Cyprinus carpio TaxID=7962 RepID=A0A8C1TEL3_CYPCA
SQPRYLLPLDPNLSQFTCPHQVMIFNSSYSLLELSSWNGNLEKDPQEQTLVQDESDAERPSKRCCAGCPFRAVRKVTSGLILGACVAVSWAWGTNSAKETLIRHPAPFFIIWFCSTWNILFFPLYYLCHLLTEKQKQLPTTEFRKCSLFLGEELTVRVVLKGAAPFSVLWSLSGYLYLLALCRISKVDVSAILCCSQAFIFLLSWIGLKDRFMGVRVSNQIGYRVLCE